MPGLFLKEGREKRMKRLTAVLAALLLCACPACAVPEGAGTAGYTLPVDFSPGMPPDPANYVSETVYEDPTICVEITPDNDNGRLFWIADIEIADASQLRTAAANGFDRRGTEFGHVLARRMNAVVAVDGDYYCYTSDTPLIIRQGVVYRNKLTKKPGQDVLLIDEDGDFHGIEDAKAGDVGETVDGKKIINAFHFGPLLVNHGQIRTGKINRHMKPEQRSQRVAIAQTGHLKYRIIVTGPNERGSRALNFEEWRQFVASMPDIEVAYNLDGGDSAVLVFRNQKVNDPDNENERPLADIIYFASALPQP